MKKVASRTARPPTTAKAGPNSVDKYLAAVPEPARSTLSIIRANLRAALPTDAEEVISYRIPAFKHNRIVLWYAAFSDHCSLFPTASVIAKFKKELAGYKISKGTIQFAVDRPLPATLLKRIVKARLAEMG